MTPAEIEAFSDESRRQLIVRVRADKTNCGNAVGEQMQFCNPSMATCPPADYQPIVIPLKRFMLLDTCPPDWRPLDLYVFRDEEVVFYVGQSYLAFERVWDHLRNGFKGRSTVGRFILCNWPVSLKFSIELMSSQAARFANVDHDLNAAERDLILQLAPCFNETLNSQPTPLPSRYAAPSSKPLCSRSLNKLIHEAERAVRADEKRLHSAASW